MTDQIALRYDAAQRIARMAGLAAQEYFQRFETLVIDVKGHQDFVSQADRAVELLVRAELQAAFPDDAIVGEEAAPKSGTSGFTWVIDPIDGTTNFLHGIPDWVVILACVFDGETRIGVTYHPAQDEMFHCRQGGGAFCDDRPIRCLAGRDMRTGSVGLGLTNRTGPNGVMKLVQGLLEEGGVLYRNGSGGLSLTYVASGKLLGYISGYMNAWDCLAGQLLVAEAGGVVEVQNADTMIAEGGRVVVGPPEVFDTLQRIVIAAIAE